MSLSKKISFGPSANRLFCRMTGDWNFIHHRIPKKWQAPFPAPVVHGMHLLLRASEHKALRQTGPRPGPFTLEAVFRSPVYVGTRVAFSCSAKGNQAVVTVKEDFRVAAIIRISRGHSLASPAEEDVSAARSFRGRLRPRARRWRGSLFSPRQVGVLF